MIDGWKCIEFWPGDPWSMREATRGNVTWTASVDGLEVDESVYGYDGHTGQHGVPANVLMWLCQAVR